MLIAIAVATFVATTLGGLGALKLRDKQHLVLGFSAGAVIGVALFDLIPEAFQLGTQFYDIHFVSSVVAVGFLLYLILDRTLFFHSHTDDDCEAHEHGAIERGSFGATSLSAHSLLDGVAIGLAFQVSPAIGAAVAVAVLVHDFSDGINTVSMVIKNGGTERSALRWLMIDAAAPVVGVMSTYFFTIPESAFGLVLALFAGFFLYIGASDLIPESHHAHPKLLTTVMTVVGATTLYVAIRFAGV
jgi:ZIP family zinc transporter